MKLFDTGPGALRDAAAPGRRFDAVTVAVSAPLQLDAAALARLRELDPTGETRLVERVFDAFEASLQRMLPQLAAGLPPSVGAPDTRGLRLIAHTLKSSATTIGALAMARQCAELERLLGAGQTAGVDGRIDALLTETVRVRQAMRRLADHAA